MNDEVSYIQKLWPMILSALFGVGSGIGATRFTFKNHEARLRSLETANHEEMLSEKTHGLLCDRNKAEMINTIGDMIEKSMGKFETNIYKRLDEFDKKRDEAIRKGNVL